MHEEQTLSSFQVLKERFSLEPNVLNVFAVLRSSMQFGPLINFLKIRERQKKKQLKNTKKQPLPPKKEQLRKLASVGRLV